MIRIKNVLKYLLAVLFVAAGINHFWHPETYLNIMPSYFPAPELLNSAAGVAEIVLGILLCFAGTQKLAAWAMAFLLATFFTVHIYMLQEAYNNHDYIINRTAAWLRLALQPVLILWALWYRKV